jgi:hypothetical protein
LTRDDIADNEFSAVEIIASNCDIIINQNEQIVGEKNDIGQSEKGTKELAVVLNWREAIIDDFYKEIDE